MTTLDDNDAILKIIKDRLWKEDDWLSMAVSSAGGDDAKVLEQFKEQSDKKDIMKLIQGRLDIGRERYGHGVIVDDDLSKYGCTGWLSMAMEEVLDQTIYLATKIVKIQRQELREKPLVDQIKTLQGTISHLQYKINDQDKLIGDLLALRK